jgi:hypothetical protein
MIFLGALFIYLNYRRRATAYVAIPRTYVATLVSVAFTAAQGPDAGKRRVLGLKYKNNGMSQGLPSAENPEGEHDPSGTPPD